MRDFRSVSPRNTRVFGGTMVAVALLISMIAAGCGGGGGSGAVVNPSPGPGGGLAVCQALANFERYRYTFSFRLYSPKPETPLDDTQVGDPPFALLPNAPTFEFPQEYEGSVVNPDRIHMIVRNPDQPELQFVYIGTQAWSLLEQRWTAATEPSTIPFPPGQVCTSVMGAPDFSAVVPVEEDLNGTATRHYRFDQVEANAAGVLLGPQSDMGRLLTQYEVDVWLTEKGWPVRLETSSEGTYPSGRQLFIEMALEIKDVNDKAITVEPPI